MAVGTAPVITLSPAELDERRLAVENAIGTLRIEGMELDAIPNRILEQYAQGEIPLEEMSRLIHEYTATIV
ncbi:MAG: antitoxin VbhA family protein [Terracidiphilus sp.]